VHLVFVFVECFFHDATTGLDHLLALAIHSLSDNVEDRLCGPLDTLIWVNARLTGNTAIKADELPLFAAALDVGPEDFFPKAVGTKIPVTVPEGEMSASTVLDLLERAKLLTAVVGDQNSLSIILAALLTSLDRQHLVLFANQLRNIAEHEVIGKADQGQAGDPDPAPAPPPEEAGE
jgi:hypothetical protein